MNIANNQRYKVSSEKIETAFLALMLNNKYEDITINQICKHANINRSTFYNHYDDINDLIIKIEGNYANAVANIFNFGERYSPEAFIDMFNFIKKNKSFYKAFLNIPYITLAESSTKLDVLKNLGNKNKKLKNQSIEIYYRANFFGAGIKEICRLWLSRDCQESPEQMTKLILDEYKFREN